MSGEALANVYKELDLGTPYWQQPIGAVPDRGKTGLACGPSEILGASYDVEGLTFQHWTCPCGQGIDAQVAPDDVLTPTIKAHLRGEWPA